MNNRQNLAEHGAGLCVWALAGLGVTANLTGAASLAVVGFIAFSAFKKYRKDRCVSAAERAAKALTPQHGMPERGINAALRLIKDLPKPVAIDPKDLKDALKRNDFPNTLYDHLFGNTYVPKDDGVEKALRIVIAETYEVLRLEDDIHKLFTQESLKELERLAALSAENDAAFQKALAELSEGQEVIAGAALHTMDRIDEVADRLLAETAELRGKLHSAEKFAAALAYKYAEDFPDDLDAALKTLASALETAAKASARNALPSNLSEAVDTIVADVERLKQDGQIEEAYDKAQAERARRKEARERQIAEDSRVLDLVIEHATYAQDETGYAEATLEQIQLDSPSAEDTFKRLRALRRERYQEGLRLGTPFALTAAAGLARTCIEIAPTPYLRAMAQNDLGEALRNQGSRTHGAEGNALLAEAVDCYRSALRVRTEDDHPLDWAMTMQNLANALQTQGDRTEDPEGNALLEDAVDSYRAALRVRTEDNHPLDWAGTMQNLANTRALQGIRIQGPEGNPLLAEAIDSYRAALRVCTEADHPVDWAMTLQNLANTLQIQGTRTQGPEGNALLAEAVDSYRAALRVRTEDDHPVDWAMTLQNLANTLQIQGNRTKGPEGIALLAEAVDNYNAALRVRTEADHPVQWAMTKENLAHAELARAEHDTTTDLRPHLQAALTHVDNALRIFDPVHMSYNHAKATALRDDILKALDAPPPSSSS
ncbi:tetratricopeptide repeat protein [Jannaschia sp. CCS1]|uniref:tetratricopeptide repeat protein n=1 Tax=Jannaschia sp. (strain CCS1) TaxID=290400 RepID=UPI000053BD14|nr:tetratricopeptide repeat protein [Jannaschia sp. CCS1]ABD54894.1 hypothetical protein Jann_1977 [Jannaschia sp. CCS1]